MIQLSFKSRLSLWHLLYVTLVLCVAALVLNWAMARLVRAQVDAALVALARQEVAETERAPHEPLRIHEASPGTTAPVFERLDKFIQITTPDGEPIARSATLGTARLPLSPATREAVARGEIVFETVEDFGEEPIRMVSVPLPLGESRYVIQVAASLDDARTVIRAARELFFVVAVAILLAVVATGALLARRAVRPIDRVVAQARRIGDSNLAARLPHPGTHDEIARLVETLNDMLSRIERTFEAQRRFTADASHELMSPLSRLRAELEVTLRRPRTASEYEETLHSCLDEVERLGALTEDLLLLARLDTPEPEPATEAAVALSPIVDEAVRRVAATAERREIMLATSPAPALTVKAASRAAALAVANVVDNAVKFSPTGGRVTVSISTDGADAVVTVTDNGPGVRPDEIALLFERFHRGSAARVAEAPGSGLGLAIARALLESQGGSIAVTSTPGDGATFSIRLPLAGGQTTT